MLISLGVCASVNVQWLIFLGTSSILTILILEIYRNYYSKKYKKNLFTMSFNEGNNLNNLEIHSLNSFDELEKNEFLIYKSFDSELYQYRLSSLSKEELLKYFEEYKDKKNIKYINFMSS